MQMDELKNRKTTRLKGADYNRNQAVFLTICTKKRSCVLSRIVGTGVLDGPQIELTTYGQIADKYINQLNDFYDDLSVESYVIMPNHIHIMLWVKGIDTELLSRSSAITILTTKNRQTFSKSKTDGLTNDLFIGLSPFIDRAITKPNQADLLQSNKGG